MAFIRFIIGIVITVAVAGFAVMNPFDVEIVFSPVHQAVTLPFYIIFCGSLFVGFLIGGFLVWLNGASVRRERRKQARDIKLLEKEVARLKDDKYQSSSLPVVDVLPALPPQ